MVLIVFTSHCYKSTVYLSGQHHLQDGCVNVYKWRLQGFSVLYINFFFSKLVCF